MLGLGLVGEKNGAHNGRTFPDKPNLQEEILKIMKCCSLPHVEWNRRGPLLCFGGVTPAGLQQRAQLKELGFYNALPRIIWGGHLKICLLCMMIKILILQGKVSHAWKNCI